MARPAARRAPTARNTAADGKQPLGGLELPEDWLAWKPFSYARKPYLMSPVAKVVESEEDLHIFGLVADVYEAVPAAHGPATRRGIYRTGRAKASKLPVETSFAPRQHSPPAPPNRHNEFGGSGRDGGLWGMATGQEPGTGGREQRRSAATPRAFAMNADVKTDRAGFEQSGRAPYPSGALPPRTPLPQQQQQQQQQPHPNQHWGALNGGVSGVFHHDNGQGQAQGYPNGGWQQDQQQPQQQQQQQQQQYVMPPSSRFFARGCPPAPVRPRQFRPPPMYPQPYPHAQHAMPQRPFMNRFQGQCYRCCRGPCQCEHVY